MRTRRPRPDTSTSGRISLLRGGHHLYARATDSRTRGLIEGTVDGAAARTSLGSAINQCQSCFAQSDHEARERFDAAFPGPGPVAVADVIDDVRANLPTQATAFADATEPSMHSGPRCAEPKYSSQRGHSRPAITETLTRRLS